MGVVQVLIGIPLLVLLVAVPGWLAFRLLLRDTGRSPAPPRAVRDLSPIECAFLTLALGIFTVGPVALVLAMFGVFAFWLLLLVVALGSAALGIAVRRSGAPPLAWHGERAAWLGLALLALAAVLFLRPGETLVGGGDAGVYYNSGVAMAKQGGILLHDPILAGISGDRATVRHLLGTLDPRRYRLYGDIRFIGFFTDDTSGEIVPQNLHLWPAWLAIFFSLFGTLGPAYAPPVCGLLGLLGLVLLARRLFGWPVALIAGLFLALNGIQVWFVRQTYSEAYQQFALMAALFGLLLLEERRDPATMRLGAVLAALALGNAALTHEETLFLLPIVIAYAVVLRLTRAWRPAHTWFFGILSGMMALAVVQAWGFALGYTEGLWHHVYLNLWAQRRRLALALILGIALLVIVDRLRARWWPLVTHPRAGRWARWTLAAATALYACYGYILRPGILTGAAGSLASYIGAPTPAGHDANLVRLGWYWSPLGILLIALGATLLIGRDLNRRTGWFLAFALVHTVIFTNETYTTDGYIYALRHDVPVILPIFALFAAYAVWNGGPALARCLSPLRKGWRGGRLARAGRAAGLVAASALVLFFIATSAGTWTVRRYSGVASRLQQIADQFPENSLLLFSGDRDQPHLLATPLQFIYGRSAFVISTNAPRGDLVEAWLERESASRPVYILMGDDGGKLFLPHTRLVPDARFGPTFTVTLHDFETLQLQKPHNPQNNDLRYTVYRFEPAGNEPPLGAPPLTVTAGQADEQYEAQGFYGVQYDPVTQTPYRWTGQTAQLRVPWTASLARSGGTVTLRLAGGKRPAALGAAHVTIFLDPDLSGGGAVLGAFDVPEGFADYTVTIPPGALPPTASGTAILRIESAKTWSPQDYAPPDAPLYDSRALGVQMQSVTLMEGRR